VIKVKIKQKENPIKNQKAQYRATMDSFIRTSLLEKLAQKKPVEPRSHLDVLRPG
jgi:hypothetical protein